jgi:hypothetical protein
VVSQSLIAFDTDHIKSYVFGTDKLKEIRGASSLFDRLNRDVMVEEAKKLDAKACSIYTNGGSGLFLIDSDQADTFGLHVQQRYQTLTAGGASITFVVQKLPKGAPDDIEEILDYPLKETLDLMRYSLIEKKGSPSTILALPSHPLMRTCDSCGVFYAEGKDAAEAQDAREREDLYCRSCLNKRREDREVKDAIGIEVAKYSVHTAGNTATISTPKHFKRSPLWESVTSRLQKLGYKLPSGVERPGDFNVFREFGSSKEYLGLIYADANGMGRKIEKLGKLRYVQKFAKEIDDAITQVVCDAVAKYLHVVEHTTPPLFPFDILLMGGDDIVIVTPSSVALQVACTLAENFHRKATLKDGEIINPDKKISDQLGCSLSAAVVLAPVKYPFGPLLDLATDALKFAKKDSAKYQPSKESNYDDSRVNFLVVTGSTSQSFKSVYGTLHDKDKRKIQPSFYATMRPYTVEQLKFLINALQEGNKQALGRSKLHQLREAVLQKNLTTSVVEGLAVLRNWKPKQRDFVLQQVYTFEDRYQLHQWDPDNPAAIFPRVSFPWFADGKQNDVEVYRTLLLDFVELYDFVAREGDSGSD